MIFSGYDLPSRFGWQRSLPGKDQLGRSWLPVQVPLSHDFQMILSLSFHRLRHLCHAWGPIAIGNSADFFGKPHWEWVTSKSPFLLAFETRGEWNRDAIKRVLEHQSSDFPREISTAVNNGQAGDAEPISSIFVDQGLCLVFIFIFVFIV